MFLCFIYSQDLEEEEVEEYDWKKELQEEIAEFVFTTMDCMSPIMYIRTEHTYELIICTIFPFRPRPPILRYIHRI